MRKEWDFSIILATLWLAILQACVSPSVQRAVPSSAPRSLTVLYQSNRLGDIEPCGCQTKPYGGIDREAEAVSQARGGLRTVFYFDAGQSLAPVSFPLQRLEHFRAKSQWLAETLDLMGLDVLAPGTAELGLGLSWFKALASSLKFRTVSSNLVDGTGQLLFDPYAVVTRGGTRLGVMAVSPLKTEQPGVVVRDARKSIRETLSQLRSKADILVLLSQFDTEENEKIAEDIPELHLIIGADMATSLDDPLWIDGHTLVLDPHINGYLLGRINLDWLAPFTGFYNPALIAANSLRLELMKKTAGGDATMVPRMELFKKRENYQEIPGGTVFDGRLIKLTQEDYSAENAITKRVQAYRTLVRDRAVKEARDGG